LLAPARGLPASSCGALLFHDPGADVSGDPIDTWRAVLKSRGFRGSLAGAPADARLDVRRIEGSSVIALRAWAPTPAAAASLCGVALQGAVTRSAFENDQRKKALADAATKLQTQIAQAEKAALDAAGDPFFLVPPENRLGRMEEQISALDGAPDAARAQKRIDQLRKQAAELSIRAFEWLRLRQTVEPLADELRRVTQERLGLEHRSGDELTVLDSCGPCEQGGQ
jgi:hypothetical protein